ncbi:unnamed protein product, partial [Hapterophycus canaliculatus]
MPVSRTKCFTSIIVAAATRFFATCTMMRSSIVLLLLPEHLLLPLWHNHQRHHLATQALSGSSNPHISTTRVGFFASAAEMYSADASTPTLPAVAATAVTQQEPFLDDGMFDPRRDYWSKFNRTGPLSTTPEGSNWVNGTHRSLASTSSNCGPASSSDPCCITCFGLSYCDVLNGYKVEDKYFPGEATILGSCDNFEDRASRLEVFGPSKTFRDTDACREMVMDYTCLWWGSANEMYANRCGIEAQVYPCRSYCVQLAKTCANNVVEWQELCRSINCPPTEEVCMPGPYT